MATFFSPGIQVTEVPRGPVAFTNIPTAVGGFLVEAVRGPVNTATLVTSLPAAQEIFGGRYGDGVLIDSLTAFFNNGGASCYVVRAVSASAAAATRQLTTTGGATSGSLSSNASTFPAVLAAGDTFIGKVNGGSTLTVTLAATAATLTGSGGTFTAGASGDTVSITVGGVLGGAAQVIDLSGVSTATAAGYEAAINAALVGASVSVIGGQLKLSSDQKGTGATIAVTAFGGAAQAKTGLSVASATGTGNVANVSAVTAAEIKTLFDATFTGSTTTVNSNGSVTWASNTTGASSSVQFTSGTGVSKIAGFDTVIHSGSTTAAVNTVLVTASSVGSWANIDCAVKATRQDTQVAQCAGSGANPAGSATYLTLVSVARIAVGDTISVTKSGDTQRGVVTQIIPSLNRVVLQSAITIPAGGYSTTEYVVNETFTVAVFDSAGTQLQSSADLRMSALSASNYFVTRINNLSRTLITVTNNSAAVSDPRPATDANFVSMTGGSDGAALTSSDWVGTQAAKTGIYAFDQAPSVNFISVPNITATEFQGSGATSLAVLVPKALEAYVAGRGDVLAVLDNLQNATVTTASDYVTGYTGSGLNCNFGSSYESIFWPWVKAVSPVTGVLDSYCPSPYVQGLLGRAHQRKNIAQAPAGTTYGKVVGVLDVDTRITMGSADYNTLYPNKVNAILPLPGNGICVFGSRTLDPTGEFGQITTRIIFNTLKRVLKDQLLFVMFENNNDTTRAAVRRLITGFLREWRLQGILQGATDDQAFFVVCDETNNTAAVINAGKLVVRVGLATQRPVEFLDITLEQDTRAAQAAAAAATI